MSNPFKYLHEQPISMIKKCRYSYDIHNMSEILDNLENLISNLEYASKENMDWLVNNIMTVNLISSSLS